MKISAQMFMVFLVCACLLSATAGWAQTTNAPPKSRVVLVRDATAVKGFGADATKVREMVARGIKTLTGQTDEAVAWRQFVSSNDVVGIKVSAQGAPLHATHRELVQAIADGLRAAGVVATNIVVWDRDAAKLRMAGYGRGTGEAFRVQAVVPDTGWDATTYYESRLVGKLIWGDLLYGKEGGDLSTRSHLPKLLTQTITKLINVPVLQDHDACGLSGCLYNVSLGAMDNTRRFDAPEQRGDPAIADVCQSPNVHDKLVLNVMDALVVGYAGGGVFKPQYSWDYGGFYFSRDPVAIDALALELLETKRPEMKLPPVGPQAVHILSAARHGLGHAALDQIELIEVSP